jgi:hypothetical protein
MGLVRLPVAFREEPENDLDPTDAFGPDSHVGEPPEWMNDDQGEKPASPGAVARSQAWAPLDVGGIFAPLEPVNYLLAPLDLCPGAPALVAGYGFSGKTVALQSLAVSIAAGQPVWGTFAARHGRVLHVDYEQGPRLTRERYQRLAVGMGVTPDKLDGRLSLVSMPQVYADGPGLEGFFADQFAGFDLVILDSLRAACPTLEENDSAVRCVLDMLNRVSGKTGACVVVIHHSRKPSQNAQGGARMAIRGSGSIYDACSSVLVFEAEKGEPVLVQHEKARTSGRCAEDFLLRIQDTGDESERGGLMVVAESAPTGTPGSTAQADLASVRARILALFEANPEQPSKGAVASQVGGRRSAVWAALDIMVAAGQLRQSERQTDRRLWLNNSGTVQS